MPWPEFSELSFAYSFLRDFERRYTPTGSFPAAPDFITQASEATQGYDVEVAIEGGTPVFLQFKRSFVIRSKAAREIANGPFAGPILYRMSLMRKNKFKQHRILQALEGSGSRVFYVTSQVPTPERLSECYVNGTVFDQAAALFSPQEIPLPNLTEDHHVTFEADANFGFVFSDEGKRFSRRVPSTRALVATLEEGRATARENRERLSSVVQALRRTSRRAGEIAKRFDDPVEQASVLAAYVLDAQMTVFNPEPKRMKLWLKTEGENTPKTKI